MLIPLGDNDWESAAENISRVRLHNLYIVEDPTSPDGMTRVTRPTLSEYAEVGDGPIYGMYRQDGTFNGDWFIVSGNKLYRMNLTTKAVTEIGNIPGTGLCKFTSTDQYLIVLRGVTAYSYNGTSLASVTIPGGQPVGSIASINSYILYSISGTGTFYWSDPGSVDPAALSFATAERAPDPIIAIEVVSDEIWLIGQSGPEVWQGTDDSNIPFIRIPARVYNEGCASRGSVCSVTSNSLPALIWVTDVRTVVLSQGSPQKISTDSVDELLKTGTNFRAWFFRFNRHSFYVLTTDELTLVFDIETKKWSRWDTYGKNIWVSHLGGQAGPQVLGGDFETNKIWELGNDIDDDGVVIVREVSGTVPLIGKPTPCNEIIVKMDSGRAPDYETEPVLEIRFSDDQGFTWSDYYSVPVGRRGNYGYEVQFRSLGMIKRPGRTFEFRFTGHCKFRIDYATMNEA